MLRRQICVACLSVWRIQAQGLCSLFSALSLTQVRHTEVFLCYGKQIASALWCNRKNINTYALSPEKALISGHGHGRLQPYLPFATWSFDDLSQRGALRAIRSWLT